MHSSGRALLGITASMGDLNIRHLMLAAPRDGNDMVEMGAVKRYGQAAQPADSAVTLVYLLPRNPFDELFLEPRCPSLAGFATDQRIPNSFRLLMLGFVINPSEICPELGEVFLAESVATTGFDTCGTATFTRPAANFYPEAAKASKVAVVRYWEKELLNTHDMGPFQIQFTPTSNCGARSVQLLEVVWCKHHLLGNAQLHS